MVRLKHRYIVCQVMEEPGYPVDFGARDIIMAIRERIQLLCGDLGAGSFGANTTLKLHEDLSRVFVLRFPRDAEMEVRMCVASVTSIKKCNLLIRVLAVAGCGRTCKLRVEEVFHRFASGPAIDSLGEVEKGEFARRCSDLIRRTDF